MLRSSLRNRWPFWSQDDTRTNPSQVQTARKITRTFTCQSEVAARSLKKRILRILGIDWLKVRSISFSHIESECFDLGAHPRILGSVPGELLRHKMTLWPSSHSTQLLALRAAIALALHEL